MDKNYHLTKMGELKRKENTLIFIPDNSDYSKTHIPIESVNAIYAHEEIRCNSKVFQLLDEHTVEIHFFSWSDSFVGSYMPTKSTYSGSVVVDQVQAYLDEQQRKNIARKIVLASIQNMSKTVSYYTDTYDVEETISTLSSLQDSLSTTSVESLDIESIMGIEGDSRSVYYDGLSKIIPDEFSFETRSYNPPESDFNALISFGNSLLYGVVSSSIQSTALHPTISYLHEPGSRRHSLSLDIADVFKPVIIDRMILRLVNRRQITPKDFAKDWYLKEEPRKTVLSEFEEVLEETIDHPTLNRKVSYQYLITLDVLNLKKHIVTNETYDPFIRWW